MTPVQEPRISQLVPPWFTRRFSHPWMPTAMYGALAILMILICQFSHPLPLTWTTLWVAVGMFAWTFIEYLLHRFVFHLTQIKQPWKEMASGLHMAHHRTVDTDELILAPPLTSMIFGGLIYLILAALTLSFATAGLIEAGIFIGYIFYEWAHYSAHKYHPRSRLGKYLKHYHLQHHFKDPHHTFGVTSPIWDRVFGTYVRK